MSSAPLPRDRTRALRWSPPRTKTVRCFVLAFGLAQLSLTPPFTGGDEREQMAVLTELARFELASPSDAAGPFHLVDAELEPQASAYEAISTDWRARVSPGALLNDLRSPEGERANARMARGTTPRFGRLSNVPLLPSYWLGRALDLSPLAQLYLARLAGLMCFTLLAGYAVSRAGPLAFALFALSALPGSLAQAASVSGEGLCNGLALCFFALLGKGWLEREPGLSERERGALLALLLALSACQPLFACAALFLFALPNQAPVRPLLCGARLCALGWALGAFGVLIWLGTNEVPVSGGAAFLLEQPIAALRGTARGLLQVDSLLIALTAFSGALVDQARFSAGVIAALGAELVFLLSWGAVTHGPRAHGTPERGGWLVAGSLVYVLSLTLWVQIAQANAGPLELDAFCARSFALVAPAALLLLSARGTPSMIRYLTARPATRVGLPLVLLNAFALSALLGRYFAPVTSAWPF